MSKLTKSFQFDTPIMKGNKNPIPVNITITGIGYFYPSYMGEDSPFDYDIESVQADGQDFTNAFHILDSDDDSRLVDLIKEATLAHMEYIFMPDEQDVDTDLARHLAIPTAAEMKEAHTRVMNGDFSGKNLFMAIGSICTEYNNNLNRA